MEGLNYWEAQIRSQGIAPVSRGFFQSEENRLRRVGLLYDGLLCRPGDADGAAYWAGQMVRASDHVLSLSIVGSAEFANNAETEQCQGSSVNDPDSTQLATLEEPASVIVFDDVADEIILNVYGSFSAGVSPYVIVISAEDGQLVQRWGAVGTETRVADVSRDGRFMLLLTGDPALTGGPAIEDQGRDLVPVMVDRADGSFQKIPIPLDVVSRAQISDDGNILWLAGFDALPSGGAAGPEHYLNAYRYTQSTLQIERVTSNIRAGGFVSVIDASASGNTVLLAGATAFITADEDDVSGTPLWIYDADTSQHLLVPYDSFFQYGPEGELDAPGNRVLAFDAAFQGRSVVTYNRGDAGVDLIGTAHDLATGDITDDGAVLAWTKSSMLNESFGVLSTTVGIRRPGHEDQTLEIEGEVRSLALSQDGSKLLLQTSSLGGADATALIMVTIS